MTQLTRLDQIDGNPWQPRTSIDPYGIEALALSIARDGLMQVPVGRRHPNEEGRYQLAIGHRRHEAYRACLADIQSAIEAGAVDQLPAPPALVDAVRSALAAGKSFYAIALDVQELTDQQMFEMAVSENIQRKDLNPIELAAAMKRYLDEFHATSEQAGAFFGVSGSTVRGTVRLLDLPKGAQSALAEGKITVGVSRQLLAAAQVVEEKTLDAMLTKIEKSGAAAEDVILGELSRSQNVVEMWSPYQGDKPRGGRDGWLLEMKNFPNKMLPALTANEAAEAGDTEQHLVNPPACNVCPYYIKLDGRHYCGVRKCFLRKTIAYQAQKLADMSRSSKIEIYQDSDGAYLALDNDHASHQKALESRIADLRLLPSDKFRGGYCWQHFDGLNQAIAKVVVVGKSTTTLAVAGSHTKGGKKTEKEKSEMRAKKLYRQRRKQLLWEYTEVAQSIFEGVPSEALKVLENWHYVGADDKIPDEYKTSLSGNADEKLEYQRRELVWAMIDGVTTHFSRTSLVKALKKSWKITTVPAPDELVGIAEKWDDEINALAAVSTETPPEAA